MRRIFTIFFLLSITFQLVACNTSDSSVETLNDDQMAFQEEFNSIVENRFRNGREYFEKLETLLKDCNYTDNAEFLADQCVSFFRKEEYYSVAVILSYLEENNYKDESFQDLLTDRFSSVVCSLEDKVDYLCEAEIFCEMPLSSEIRDPYYHPITITKEEIDTYIKDNESENINELKREYSWESNSNVKYAPPLVFFINSEDNITIYSTYGSLNGIDVIFDSEGSKVKAPSADFSEQTKEKQIQKSTSRTCPNCKGTGQVTFYATDNPWEQGTIDDCPMCHGTGKVTD